MSEMVRYGILPNPYTPGVLVDFYGNPLAGAGSGWPTVNGAGPGNLVAETPSSDTVGYNLTDQGTGGIHISATGTVDNEGIELLYSGAAVADNGGIALVDNSAVSAGISLVVNDTDNPGGITLTSQGNGGVGITDNGSGGINLTANGAGGMDFEILGAGGFTFAVGAGSGPGAGFNVVSSDADGINLTSEGAGGVNVTADSGGGDITLNNNSTGQIILIGVPSADPHISGALYTTAGALMVSP